MSRNTSYQRNARLSELIREIISETIRSLGNPILEFSTVTKVIVDNNLNRAQILISTLSKSEKKVLNELEKNIAEFIKALNSQARLKQMPVLSFEIDEGLKASHNIENLLKELDVEDPDIS